MSNTVFLKEEYQEEASELLKRNIGSKASLGRANDIGREAISNFFKSERITVDYAQLISERIGMKKKYPDERYLEFSENEVRKSRKSQKSVEAEQCEELSVTTLNPLPLQLILDRNQDFSSPPEPGDPLHPLSPFQIIDADAEEELLEKLEYGSQAIRIKGPHKSGKTTLLCRVCHRFIEQHSDEQVAIAYLGLDDPLQAPDMVLSQHSEFVAFLMQTINNSVENSLNSLPDISNSPNPRSSFYKCLGQLLEKNSGIVIIVLDGLEGLFQHPQSLKSYETFFKFLDNTLKRKPYNRVRTIFVNSTDEYVATHHLASPLNVGHVVEISWLNKSHKDAIGQLIQAYQLPVDDNNYVDEMLWLFGGMPYFIHAALSETKRRGIPLSNVLELFRAPKSIFSNELLSLIESIRNYDSHNQGSDLEGSLKKIVNSDGFVLIGDKSAGITYVTARLLESLGVAIINTQKAGQQSVAVSSELYRLFFKRFVW